MRVHTKTNHYSKAQLKRILSDAWHAFARVAECSSDLDRAIAASETAERNHRRFMKHGPYCAEYALSVYDSARYFVIKNTSKRPRKPRNWEEANIRHDVAICYGLSYYLKRTGRKLPGLSRAFKLIDYAGDIAL